MKKRTIFFLIVMLYGCIPIDYRYSLPNEYKLIETSNIQIIISNPNRFTLFQENITGINIQGDIVSGRVDALPPELQRLTENKDRPGYFVLNTNTGLFQLGLGKRDWLRTLKQEGILKEPTLLIPSVLAIGRF